MAIVDIPGRESLEVPDVWGSDEVTDFVRQRYPDLFEAPALSNTTYGPDRAPLTPEARATRIAEIRGTPAENRRFAEGQSRIADLDALEAAREAGGIRSFLEASDIMAGPRRVAAGASNFLRVPGAIANIQLAPLLGIESTRPAAERAAQLLADLDRSISGAGDVLRSTERRDAEPTLADVARSARDLGPTAALADLGTLGVNAIADSAAYILPGALVARGLAGAGVGEKAARILGPMISVAPVETADALAEYVETNANPIAARVVAPIVGFINGALESVTDAGVLARLGGGDAAKKSAARFLVGQILGEGVTEGLQEGATIGGRAALTGDPGPDALNRLGTAVVGGAFGGAGIGGVTEAVRRMVQPAETPIGARGVPVEVARAELDSGAVPVGPAPPSAPVPEGVGAARDYIPLGKRKAKKVLDFARIAEEEGVADMVDFIPEAKTTPDGVPIEAEFSGGRARVYTPNIRSERRFREALREEKAHGWIASEPGQVALTEFLDRQPLTDAEFTKLQQEGYVQNPDEDVGTYTRRLSDEFVAKLNRDPKWKQWVGEVVAWVKKSIGVSLTNTQAGRLMLRNLRRAGVGTGGQSRASLGPAPAPGMVRLYRGDTRGADTKGGVPAWVQESPEFKATVDASGRWFTTNLKAAEEYRSKFGDGSGPITFVDLPAAEAAKYNVANQPEAAKFTSGGATGALAAEEFFLPREVAQQAKVHSPVADFKPRYSLGGRRMWGADPSKYQLALTMERRGATPDEIWEATEDAPAGIVGWWKLGDDWMAEIDDSGTRLKGTPPDLVDETTEAVLPTFGTVFDFLDAPKLFEAYQWIRWIPVRLKPLQGGVSGYFNATGITLNQNLPAKEMRDTLLHELQHAIQAEEGFAQGASEDTVFSGNAFTEHKKWFREYERLSAEGKVAEALAALEKSTEAAAKAVSESASAIRLGRSGYMRTQGEALARLAEMRADISHTMRRYVPPWRALSMMLQAEGTPENLIDIKQVSESPRAPLFSLAPTKLPAIVEDIRRQFPSAPPITVADTPDPRGAYFDGTSIVVSPSTLPSNPASAKSVITAALVESGLTRVFADDFVESTFAMLRAGDPTRTARMAERLGADTKTPEGQRAVLSEVLRLQQDSRRMAPILRRWMAKFKIAESDPLADELDRAMRTTLAAYEGSEPIPSRTATPQEQIFADINRSVWTYARPVIQDLRNRALEERFDAEDTARHRNMSNRMNALADNARARDIGAGVEQEWNPVDADFIPRLEAAGVSVTDSDRTLHSEYRREALARGLVPTLDALNDVDDAIADVMRAKPNYDITSDELTAERELLQRRIDAADEDILSRAMELRSRAERRWQSRAAVEALRDPQIAAWYDIIERIEMSGATPREGPTSPNLADAATVARDTLALTWAPFRRRTQEAYDKFMAEVYPAALTPLRQRLERLRSDRAQAHIAVGEILAALRGVMGLSGSTEDRATAEFLLENDELLRRFTVSLAQATPDGEVARLRDRIMQGEEATEADVRVAARDAGISPEQLARLAGHLRRSPGIRNAVVEGMAAINRSIADSAIAAIREIESDPEAAERMAPVINRFTRSRGRAATNMTGVEQEIQELEARRLNLELLRDAGATEIPESELGVAEMIYDGADGGIILKGFTKADGTEQPQLVIRPGDEYSNATLAQLSEWQENARAAVEAESNEAPVTRGLNVGIQIANLYIDASFTPDQIAKTPAPGMLGDMTRGSILTLGQNIGNRNTLARAVYGVQGRALMAAARELDLAGQSKDAITKSYVRRHYRAMKAAADSLKLNLFTPGDSRLLKKARNEVAHRFGRVFEAGPAVGELLISLPGKRITPELMTLIRLDREIGRKAQEKERNRSYGGIRINLPGQRIVRPAAETGDVGLSRTYQNHEDTIRALAEAYQSKDPLRIVAFWDGAQSEDGLLWHVLDSERADLGTPRQLQQAEQTAARQIIHRHVPAPKTFDEMVSLLMDVSGLARSEIRSKLLAELAEYGRLASAKFPKDGARPKEVEGTFSGEGDQTPFTMQAAPLIYPSSWYDYGSANSLDQFLEMIVDVPQREYLTRAKESAAELNAVAERIRKAVADNDTAELKSLEGVIRWYSNKLVSMWRGQTVTTGRAEKAAKYMNWVAKQLLADIAPTGVTKVEDALSRTIGGIMPALLSGMNAMLTNVVQGGMTSFAINRPVVGSTRAAGIAIARMLLSSANFVQDRAEASLRKLGYTFPSYAEQLAFLEGYGVAGSYSRMESGESEAWSRGETTAGPIRRAVQGFQDVANRVSEIKGVRLGDSFFNRMATRSIIPGWVRRMQRVHDAWAARLKKEGLTYDGTEKTYLTSADVAGAPEIRQQLGQFAKYGGTPEEILMRIASVKPKRFYRDPVVAKIGSFLLSELNAATRSNRPQSNPLLALMGWTSHVIGLIAADVRTTPDTNRAKALAQIATRTLGFATVSAFAAYLGMAARRGANIGRTELAEALQQILLGLDDDEDIDGLLDAMAALARAIRKIPGASYPLDFTASLAGAFKTPPTDSRMLPIDSAWWGQPVSDMALDLMAAPIRGIGIDPENPKFPTFGIVQTLLESGLQTGRGVLELAAGDEGSVAAGKADVSEGIRKVSTLLSMFGTVPYNMIDPGAVESKAAKADVVRAARDAGIPIEAPKRGTFGGIMPATPVEAALRNAARAGDEDRMRALTKFAFDRSYERAVDKGQSPDEARAAGEASVKSLLTALDPVRDALGSSITAEQYAKLEPKLTPRVRAEMANRDRAVQVISARPPEGMRTFRPTPAMMTPVRQERGRGVSRISSRRRGGRRRASYLARRRGAGRRVRRPRLRI